MYIPVTSTQTNPTLESRKKRLLPFLKNSGHVVKEVPLGIEVTYRTTAYKLPLEVIASRFQLRYSTYVDSNQNKFLYITTEIKDY